MADQPTPRPTAPKPDVDPVPPPSPSTAAASRVGEGDQQVGKTDEMRSPVGGTAGTSR